MPRTGQASVTQPGRALALAAAGLGCLLSGVFLSPPATASPTSAVVAARTPIQVQMASLSPSTLLPGRDVDVTGTVRNVDEQTWGNLKVYLVVSATPMTTREELLAAVESEPETEIGNRIIAPRSFAELGDLDAGANKDFFLTVPFRALSINDDAPGVYWIGVHVLATPPEGIRDNFADARDRTFIPLVPDQPQPTRVRLGLLWPFTEPVAEVRDGVYADDRLGASMTAGGRLGDLLAMAGEAPPARLSWLVDPALLVAAEQMSDGYRIVTGNSNQGRFAAASSRWLADFLALTEDAPLLALPYGDPDPTSLAHNRLGGVLATAVTSARTALAATTGLDAQVGVWPVDGMSDRRGLAAMQRSGASFSLLSDRSLQASEPDSAPEPLASISTAAGVAEAVVIDTDIFTGGPGPGDTDSALQVRQRLLAETALLAIGSAGRQTADAVASPPRDWDPGKRWAAASFFDGLVTPWLRMSPLTRLLAAPAGSSEQLRYPAASAAAELPKSLVRGVGLLRRAAGTLSSLLVNSTDERLDLDRALSLGASVHWRADPATGELITDARSARVRRSLRLVDIEASRFVTLSSASGRFPVTIINRLDQGIVVGLSVLPGDPAVRINAIDPVTIQAGQRTTVTVIAHTQRVGLTNLDVRAVTESGRAFGTPRVVDIRATQYGVVGWAVIGVGLTVLAGASAVRIVRRIGSRRRSVATSTTR